MADDLLPWERVVWEGGLRLLARGRHPYTLTDSRVIWRSADTIEDLPLADVAAIHYSRTWLERTIGRCTLQIRRRDGRILPLQWLSHALALELVLALLSQDGCDFKVEPSLMTLAVNDMTRGQTVRPGVAVGTVSILFAVAVVAIRLQGTELPVHYPANDAIYPGGVKKDRAAIIAFMEREVMPLARETLGPVVGGADRVRCETCHGVDGRSRDWKMPGVAELPYPRVRTGLLEQFGHPSDPQVRNAVYADLAQDDRQSTAGYMRQVVMPRMARLLGRPPYDFTQSYSYNRGQFALGCYHCHRVDESR